MTVMRRVVALGMVMSLSACTTLNATTFTDDMGAIRGFDAVAYHSESRAIKGSSEFSYQYDNVTWSFASRANLDKFRDDPERYAPQYGGFCAYAMSQGYVVSSDPNAWTIVDDKLFLNYSLGVRRTWLKDVPGYVSRANANWQQKISMPSVE